MKTQTTKLALMIIGIGILFTSCQDVNTLIPSGNVTKQERAITDYNGIEVSTAMMVDVSFSTSEESIVVEADDNLQQHIIVEKVNNVLKIRIANNTNIRGNSTIKVHIVTKENIDYYAVSDASYVIVKDTIKTQTANINVSGASTFLSSIISSSLISNVDGASTLSLSGNVDSFQLRGDEASKVDGYGFSVNKLDIRISGASEANLTVNSSIDIDASGASSLLYKGNASITSSNLTQASKIIKVD